MVILMKQEEKGGGLLLSGGSLLRIVMTTWVSSILVLFLMRMKIYISLWLWCKKYYTEMRDIFVAVSTFFKSIA